MVPSYMSNTTPCPVCGGNITINSKRQLTEHKKSGEICYGSFMPANEPKFMEVKPTRTLNQWHNGLGDSSLSGSSYFHYDNNYTHNPVGEIPLVPPVVISGNT